MIPADYDRYLEILNSTGVEFSTWQSNDSQLKGFTLSAGDEKVSGYSEFITEIHFDLTGKFLEFNLIA